MSNTQAQQSVRTLHTIDNILRIQDNGGEFIKHFQLIVCTIRSFNLESDVSIPFVSF